MKLLNKIFTGIVCGTLITNSGLGAVDCSNASYKRTHPERCRYITNSNDTLWTLGGGALAIGGIAALVGMITGGGGDSSSGGTPSSSSTQYVRSIAPTQITHNGTAPDFTTRELTQITKQANYSINASAYDDIQLAYSIARGYTGLGTKIAVFDTDLNTPNSHGAAVMAIASGTIAPNAAVQHRKIANSTDDFMTYDQIGTVINTTVGANVYNNSWNVSGIAANTIQSRTQLENATSYTFLNAVSSAATNKDAIFVWAAGNEGYSQSGMLSSMPNVMSELNGHFVNVVAWDSQTSSLAEYSNACGITKNYCITAPGAIKTSDRYTHVGTSFATPVVSAAIAVIREAWPYLNATQITNILFETAADLGEAGIDEIYGHGMLDLENATRPVGQLSVATSGDTTQPLHPARVSSQIAHNIKSSNPTMAFFDAYGRAYKTTISDNISAQNRGLGFERMRGNAVHAKINLGTFELGFYNSDILNGTGFMQTDDKTPLKYIARNFSINVGNIELFSRYQFGMIHPNTSPDSIISDFSDIYTTSASLGLRGNGWHLLLGIPDTVIYGNMNLHTAIGRDTYGKFTYQDYKINLVTTPAIEYNANWRFLTAGFVDNPYGKDEVYIFAKTKLHF